MRKWRKLIRKFEKYENKLLKKIRERNDLLKNLRDEEGDVLGKKKSELLEDVKAPISVQMKNIEDWKKWEYNRAKKMVINQKRQWRVNYFTDMDKDVEEQRRVKKNR